MPIDERIPARANEEERGLYAAVETLDHRSREVILMHYYQEMTVHEIAAVLCISESAVYKRIESARRRLRKALERKGDTWMRTDCARP